MSSNNSGCGFLPSLLMIILSTVVIMNPNLEDGKKKVEADVSNRTLIKENNVRLYRDN